ncbi:hypothetical protein NM688_g1890 [Phlebia brevispora]|uniref:Uncharacterized protein n=1 Tax=Phlebia brevispora TaxID=194682 RepID=A0ACC1TA85_9APHY|nr:hypothetical protein NM688_g1890 [Phlebia brevispora]
MLVTSHLAVSFEELNLVQDCTTSSTMLFFDHFQPHLRVLHRRGLQATPARSSARVDHRNCLFERIVGSRDRAVGALARCRRLQNSDCWSKRSWRRRQITKAQLEGVHYAGLYIALDVLDSEITIEPPYNSTHRRFSNLNHVYAESFVPSTRMQCLADRTSMPRFQSHSRPSSESTESDTLLDRFEYPSFDTSIDFPIESVDKDLYIDTPEGPAFYVPADFFVEDILPRLRPELNLDALIDRNAFRFALSAQGKLWGYTKKSPSGIHGTNVQDAFKHFQSGVRRIVSAVKKCKPTLTLCNNKSGESRQDFREPDSLPDAFFLPIAHSAGPIEWTDIAVVGEYQVKHGEDSAKDRDPRRRFVYGFTVDDADIKLWYCDRSQILVSRPFNFIKEYRILLRFVLSLSFAGLHQLGWDPTMQAVQVEGHPQYDITVRPADSDVMVYRTQEVLYEADSIRGHGTKVWKAVKLVDGEESGPPVALKDSWVDSAREREGDNVSRSLQGNFSKEHPELSGHIMRVQVHGDVFIGGVPDRTPSYFHSPRTPATEGPLQTTQSLSQQEYTEPTLPPQIHYRIVYEEVGESLEKIHSLHTVFKALEEALYALIAMHESGWVHRDLSPGNIVIVDGVARITDLELATCEASQRKVGKTGTPNFMPIEVATGQYLFRPHETAEELELETLPIRKRAAMGLTGPALLLEEETISTPKHAFRYNPLHDLEALWWIAVYFTVKREVESIDGEATSTQGATMEQRRVAQQLFYNLENRRAAFLFSGWFADKMRCLHPSLERIADILNRIRIVLRAGYTEAEKSLDLLDFHVAEDAYGHMCVLLQDAAEIAKRSDIRIASASDRRDAKRTSLSDEILPPLLPHFRPPNKKLDQLIDRGTFKHALSARRRLWGFSKTSPSGIHGTIAQEAFKPFQSGVRRVVNAIKKGKPTVALRNNTEGESSFEKRTQDSLPDAFFLPVSRSFGPVQWSDIAVIGEYQVEDNEESAKENIRKMSQSLLNCMQKDPRRRFAFGFTAEDASIKLWYCDRSQIVVSSPFNFLKEYRTLLWFILSLSFSELHQLGWDPTMREIHVDNHLQYDITVRSADAETVVYRTLGLLSDSNTHDILGRGTRVWKAVKLVDGEAAGSPVALKDAWVDSTREREGDNVSQILQGGFAKEHPELNEHIMKVQTHGDVFVAGVQDHTPTFLCSGSASANELSPRAAQSRLRKGDSAPVPQFQVHYRIVYQEVGESLAEVTSLYTVFKALEEALYGVLVMHKSGWVHRDLSPGNIVIVDGAARVTDLEYATSEASRGKVGKTGTANFMPVEVASCLYFFVPDKTTDELEAPAQLTSNGRTGELPGPSPSLVQKMTSTPRHEFRYNPLHDLEALWWIAVYFTVNREVDSANGEETGIQGATSSQRHFAQQLFYDLNKRQTVMLSSTWFENQLECLHPSLEDVGYVLNDMLILLRTAYTAAEKSIELIDFDIADGAYGQMCANIQEAAEICKKANISMRRFGTPV